MLAPEGIIEKLWPAQMLPPLTASVGVVFTVMDAVADFTQLLASVTFTVYIAVDDGVRE